MTAEMLKALSRLFDAEMTAADERGDIAEGDRLCGIADELYRKSIVAARAAAKKEAEHALA